MMKRTLITLITLFSLLLVHGQREEYTWDIITFEEPSRFLEVDTTAASVWEIGMPNKLVFNGSYAGWYSVFTGTAPLYPANNHSMFTLLICQQNVDHYPYSVYLEFMHRLDSEKGKDGGYIDVSYDGGQTWTNVIEDRSACYVPGDDFETEGLYSQSDTLYNGEYGFSGELHTWSKVRFGWEYCLTKAGMGDLDTMLLRFNFISDGNESFQEGWNIDHIRLFSMPIFGSTEGDRAGMFNVVPNPAVDEIRIFSADGSAIDRVRLYDLNGKLLEVFDGTSRLSVADNPAGIYFLEIKSGDLDSFKKFLKQ